MLFAASCASGAGSRGGEPADSPDAQENGGGGSGGSSADPEPTKPPAKLDAASTPTETPPVTEPDAGATPTEADAAPPAAEPDASGPPPITTGPGSGDYSCTLVIGIAATGQWFGAGFEKLVDNAKWELMAVHSGFIQGWSDPKGAFWSMGASSACAANAKTPDRVIQVALWLHWEDATVDQWVAELDKVVKNWKAKNPNLKRLEFATFVRAPGDKPCAGSMPFKSWIKPEQDMAYEKIAAMYPGLVFVAPRWEVKSCADFGGNPPHFTGGGATAAAKQIADYYNMK
jgi:hypothetical protein